MFGCRLSEIMGERRLSVADVARGTGIHRNVVTKYYRDEVSQFSADVMTKLCDFLDVEISDLLVSQVAPTYTHGVRFNIKDHTPAARDEFLRAMAEWFEPDEWKTDLGEESSEVLIYRQNWIPDDKNVRAFIESMLGWEGLGSVGYSRTAKHPKWTEVSDSEEVPFYQSRSYSSEEERDIEMAKLASKGYICRPIEFHNSAASYADGDELPAMIGSLVYSFEYSAERILPGERMSDFGRRPAILYDIVGADDAEFNGFTLSHDERFPTKDVMYMRVGGDQRRLSVFFTGEEVPSDSDIQSFLDDYGAGLRGVDITFRRILAWADGRSMEAL